MAAVLLLAGAACETTLTNSATVLDHINTSRAEAGVGQVSGNLDLMVEADRWARHLRDTCASAHRSDIWEGVPSNAVLVGENVGAVYHVGGDSAASLRLIHDAFMESPSHRSTIVHRDFTHVGIGVVLGTCGVTGAAEEYWVVHIFARLT